MEKDLDWTRNASAETLLEKAKGLFAFAFLRHACRQQDKARRNADATFETSETSCQTKYCKVGL